MSFDARELTSVLCGDLIGEGSTRKVYHCRMNRVLVIKVETAARSFQNVAEWEIWKYVEGGPLEKWFAPCFTISNAGSVLIMRKVVPLRESELPKRMPEFIGDLKIENFGWYNDRIVCADYGTGVAGLRHASTRLTAAKWR